MIRMVGILFGFCCWVHLLTVFVLLLVWQIAQRDYKFGKGSNKSLTKVTYDAVGNHFRKLWGKEAGWAHSVLFTADLRTFSDRLAATTKKVEVKTEVKEERDGVEDVEVKTTVTTAMAVPTKRPIDEEGVKIEDDDETGKPNTLVQASQTTTRRMSKRLRNR